MSDIDNYLNTAFQDKAVVSPEAAEKSALNRAYAYGLDQEQAQLDIQENGINSQTILETDQKSVKAQQEVYSRAVVEAHPDLQGLGDVSDTLIQGYQNIQPDVEGDMDEVSSLLPVNTDEYEKQQLIQQVRQKRLSEDPVYKQEVYAQQLQLLSNLKELEYGEFATELGISTIPMHLDSLYLSLRNHLLPDKPLSVQEAISSGEILDDLKKHVQTLPKEERLEFFEKAFNYLKNDSLGWIADNEPAIFFTMQELMEDEITGEEHDLSEWLLGLASTLDKVALTAAVLNPAGFAAGIAKPFVQAARLVKFSWGGKSPLKSIATTNPNAAEDVARQAFNDPDIIKQLGVDPDDIAVGVHADDGVRIPQVMIDEFSRSRELAQQLAADAAHNTLIFEPEHIASAKEGVRKILNRQYPQIHNPSMKFSDDVALTETKDFSKIAYEAYMGVSNKDGFLTLRDAKQAAKDWLTEESFATTKFFKKTPEGEFVEMTGKALEETGDGAFFFKLNGEINTLDGLIQSGRKLNPEDIDAVNLMPRVVKEGIRDNAAMYSQPLSRWLDNISNQNNAFAKELRTIFDPFVKAKTEDQMAVIKRLAMLQDEGKPLTARWVLDQGFTPAQRDAAWSYKMTTDSMHYLLNDKTRRKLFSQGFKHITIKSGDEAMDIAGKSRTIDEVEWVDLELPNGKTTKGVRFYDVESGTIKTLTKSEANDLYNNGSAVYRVNEDLRAGNIDPDVVGPIQKSNEVSNYVIVKSNDTVKELPTQVLNYNPSYIAPQVYDKPLFVRVQETVIRNGKPSTYWRAVSANDTFGDARAFAKDYELNHPGAVVKVDFAKELGTVKELEDASEQVIRAQGRLFYSKRAEKRLDGSEGRGVHIDYAEAMIKGIDATSNQMVRQDSLEHLKRLWVNTYGNITDGYPKSITDLGTDDAAARILYNKIEALSSFKRSQWAENQRKVFVGLAGLFGNNRMSDIPYIRAINNTLAKGSIGLSKAPLDSLTKATAFKLFILGAPIRQLYIQGQQFMMLSPLIPSRMPQAMATTASLIGELGARKMGMNPMTRGGSPLLKDLNSSGLLETIDLHAHMDGIMAEHVATTKNIGRTLVTALDTPFKVAGAGFRGGEALNRIASWSIARERFFLKTGRYPKGKRELDSVNADAAQLTLSITKDSAYNWQQGVLGAFTQFLSVQAKALSAVTLNKSFTKWEKARMAFGQGLFFGAQGFGIAELVDNYLSDRGTVLDPEVRTGVTGGLVDWITYNIIGEHIKLAESQAPIGGVPNTLANYIKPFFGLGNKSVFEVPPGVQAAGRLHTAYKQMEMLWHGTHGEPPAEDFIRGMAMITSGFSNYTRARAIDKYNSLVGNRSGNPIGTDLNEKAQALIALIGPQTQAEKDYYRLMEITKGVGNKQAVEGLKADAIAYARTLKTIVSRLKQNPDEDSPFAEDKLQKEVVDNIVLLNNTLKATHGENYEAMRVWADEYLEAQDPTTLTDMNEMVLSNIISGYEYSEDATRFAAYVARTASHLTQEQQESLKMTLESMVKEGQLEFNQEDIDNAFN